MNYLALQSGDWAVITVLIIIFGSVIGGMVKFYQALQVLRKGKPEVDPKVALEQEEEFQDSGQSE